MKKFGLVVVAAALVALVGCQQVTETKTNTVVQSKKVGDKLIGDYVVTYVDAKDTGYIAFRAAKDKSGDNDIRDAGEGVAAQIGGTFTANVTLAELSPATYLPSPLPTTYTAGTDDKITWVIGAPVFIGQDNANSATITIEAGALITASGGAAPGMLVISRGSKIDAVGTAAKPIVFTSDRLVGSRAAGDWGGVIINGNAPINDGDDGNTAVAGGSAEGEGNTGKYGGTTAADNSGTMKYVRIEFAGKLFTADNELNGLALQGVGSATSLSYIQVHQSADDGIEFFGGTASIDHFVLTGNQDDSLDWTSGWVGVAQFGIAQAYFNSDRGIEADNKSSGNGYLPRSNPTLANLTVVGNASKAGATFRAGTDAKVYNSIFTNQGSNKSLVHDDTSGDANTITYSGVVASNGYTDAAGATGALPTGVTLVTLANTLLPTGAVAATGTAVANQTYSVFAFQPTSSIAGYTAADLSAVTGLTATNYAGALQPADATGAVDWTTGWTTKVQN